MKLRAHVFCAAGLLFWRPVIQPWPRIAEGLDGPFRFTFSSPRYRATHFPHFLRFVIASFIRRTWPRRAGSAFLLWETRSWREP